MAATPPANTIDSLPVFYDDNLEVGRTIKRLVKEGKISINGLDKDFKLNIITNSQ